MESHESDGNGVSDGVEIVQAGHSRLKNVAVGRAAMEEQSSNQSLRPMCPLYPTEGRNLNAAFRSELNFLIIRSNQFQ
jgi:hypothetical protein